jgi:hypothetical protein
MLFWFIFYLLLDVFWGKLDVSFLNMTEAWFALFYCEVVDIKAKEFE